MNKTARRYNNNKIRYELIPTEFEKELARVYTIGAEKYTIKDEEGNIIDDGANNWRKGLSWKDTIGAVKRHIAKFEEGEDFDKDYPKELLEKYGPTYHLANAAWGLASLLSYYKIYPEGDDRPHKYLKPKRIGLDIDDVLAEWCPTFSKLANIDVPKNWNFGFPKLVAKMIEDGMDYQEVIENLPMKTRPEDIPFEPVVYITHRSHTPVEVAERWIAKNGYAQAPVVQTENKIQACIDHKVDIFVDDKYNTFVQMNKAGICCFLFDAPHNHRYDVGHKRIYSLKELA